MAVNSPPWCPEHVKHPDSAHPTQVAPPAPLAQVRRDGLLPALLFYECLLPGDPLPADRGRAALHDTATPYRGRND